MLRLTALVAAALLYGAIGAHANPALADGLDAEARAELEALRDGGMEKLVIHEAPKEAPDKAWVDAEGNEVSLADFDGKVVVLNFWATWCPPCLAEMPSLDRLAGELDEQGLAVVPLSTDRGGTGKIEKFYEEIGAEHIAIHHDEGREVVRQAGVMGLPVTLLIDRQGREVARLVGDAEWDGEAAKAILTRLLELTAPDEPEPET